MSLRAIVDRYLEALGLARRAATLDFLTAIAERHVAAFAFSSVGPRLGDDLPLDVESLFDRIVVRGRGGYCFEHNGLLFEVLRELGFDVRLQLARVIHNQDIHPGLTHRITLVQVEGRRYVVDVGFGPLGPAHPVVMPGVGPDPANPHFRVIEHRPGELHMQRIVDEKYYSLYRFDLATYGQADCEVGHFYSHRHPAATFVNTLVASRILALEVRSLRNRDYWIIRPGSEDRTEISGPEQLQAILEDDFGIRVTVDESRRLFS